MVGVIYPKQIKSKRLTGEVLVFAFVDIKFLFQVILK